VRPPKGSPDFDCFAGFLEKLEETRRTCCVHTIAKTILTITFWVEDLSLSCILVPFKLSTSPR